MADLKIRKVDRGSQSAPHIGSLNSNLADVRRLLQIHRNVAGNERGRKYGVEVLNKSAIVLLVACWEAYVEDLAKASFDRLLDAASNHSVFPMTVLTRASKPLKDSSDERAVWDLAGSGWRQVVETHRDTTLEKYVDRLNTPSAKNIDELFTSLLGIKSLSKSWSWSRLSSGKAVEKLSSLIDVRGQIAHRVEATESVRKGYVTSSADMISRLAVCSHNRVVKHLSSLSVSSWSSYRLG